MQQPLLDAHIQYFKRVIVGEEGEGGAPIVSSALTEPRSKRGFSFWSWFCASIELKKKFLPEQQEVVRFMSRDDVKRLLRNDVPGTFILRFSESCLGAVTVAFVDDSGRVVHLQPWNGSDLKARSIADRIKDLSVLQFVVCRERRRHKDEIFGEFYSAVEASSMDDVYVTTQMVLAMCRSQQHKEEVEGEYCEAVEEEDDLEDIIEMMDQAVDEIGTHFYPKRSSMEDFETWLARGVCVGDVGEEEEEWVRSMGLCM